MLPFVVVLFFVGRISATGLQCAPGSGSEVGQLSDAAFWKGIDGAQFITELDDSSHDQFVQDNPNAFIMYYATWCGYSKQARKGFGGAAKKLNTNVGFGAVDCEKNSRNTCNGEHRVDGYPTFFLYKGGDWVEEYPSGDRSTNAFVKYLNKK